MPNYTGYKMAFEDWDVDRFQKKSRLLPIKLNGINVELLEESKSLCRNGMLTPMFLKNQLF